MRKIYLGRFAVFTIFSLLLIPPAIAEVAPKPGAPCPKANVSSVYKGRIYYCTKNHGKLNWDMGAPYSKSQAPQPNSVATSTSSAWFQGNWDVPSSTPFAPSCPAGAILTKPIADLENIKSITPLGFVQSDAHNTPVPHLYVGGFPATGEKDSAGLAYVTKRFPVYAPADIEISGVITTVTSPYTEYSIGAHVCGTKYLAFNHLDEIRK